MTISRNLGVGIVFSVAHKWLVGAKLIRHFAFIASSVCAAGIVELEYRFHRFVVHTPGAKIMNWLAIPARFFKLEGERSRIVFDQIVALSIANLFFKLSYFVFKIVYASQQRALALGGLKAILLHGEHLSPKMYQLSGKFIGGRRDLCFIQRSYSRFVNTDCLADARNQAHNVHKNSPVVDESRVAAADSTTRGNIGGANAPR